MAQHATSEQIQSAMDKITQLRGNIDNIRGLNSEEIARFASTVSNLQGRLISLSGVKNKIVNRFTLINNALNELIQSIEQIPDVDQSLITNITTLRDVFSQQDLTALSTEIDELVEFSNSLPETVEPSTGGYKYGALKSKKSKRSKLGMLSSKTTKSKNASKSTKTKTKKSKK